jgi:DNA-directed RNA polymerase specialized sigma54-like protein
VIIHHLNLEGLVLNRIETNPQVLQAVLNLINKEPKDSPYSDRKIAELTNLTRKTIKKCRQDYDIKDSNHRKIQYQSEREQ